MAVLYTTHYMEEAERLCDRIGIIDDGVIQAEGTRNELIRIIGELDEIRLAGTGQVETAAAALRSLGAVERVAVEGRDLILHVHEAPTAVASVVTAAGGAGMELEDVVISRPDLESVFLHLTGKGLRD